MTGWYRLSRQVCVWAVAFGVVGAVAHFTSGSVIYGWYCLIGAVFLTVGVAYMQNALHTDTDDF